MNDPVQKRRFMDFNLGHLLTILAMVIGGLGLYVQREKDMASLKFVGESHAAEIQQLASKVTEMDRSGTTASQAKIESQRVILTSLAARAEAQWATISKVEVMANDITWIKQEMLRQQR